MNLSNKLTFSLVFSVVFVALIAFAATPVMAITTVTAQVTEVVDASSTTGAIVQGKKVVTIKYSENADPKPTLATFTSGTSDPNDLETVATTPDSTLSVTFAEVDASTFLLAFLGPTDGTLDPVIPSIKLPGYTEIAGNELTGDAANDPASPFVLEGNTLAGKGYAIVATYYERTADGDTGNLISSVSGAAVDVSTTTNGSFPTLPTRIASGEPIVRLDWNNHFDATSTTADLMPDLWAHFQLNTRGTLDLTVVHGDASPIDGTFTPTDEGATTRAGDVNARTVVINEVMWARDNSQVGSDGYIREQWIEIYNTKTTPVPFENIWFTLSNDNPAPTNASTDRLSTNPTFLSKDIWDITGKGQDGNAVNPDNQADKEFISMQRTSHGNGWAAGSWGKSGDLFLPNFRGTPGMANSPDTLPDGRNAPGTTNPPKNKIVINEIGNSSTENHDWIELKNVTDSDQSLKGYSLTLVTGYDTEADLFDFGNDDKVLANGHLLLLNSHPQDNKHSRGFDIRTAVGDQLFGVTESTHRYLVVGSNKIQIPADGNWMLILRSSADNKFHNSSHNIHDVAGPGGGQGTFVIQDLEAASPRKDDKSDGADDAGDIWDTRVWPLNGQRGADGTLLRISGDNKVWARDTGKQGFAKDAFKAAGYTGIGYDRKTPANDENGGTPGFPNDAAKSTVADIGGRLIVSELMLTTDDGRYPQWIELKNTSTTHGINFGGPAGKRWRIEFENHNSGTWQSRNRPLNVKFDLIDLFPNGVPPGQTLLIVSTTVRGNAMSNPDHFPAHRVASIEQTKKSAFGLANKRDVFLNVEGGFTITIKDSAGQISDMVGNLDGKEASVRAGIPLDDPYGWDWPTTLAADGSRTSLIRLKNDDGTPRAGTPVRPVEDDPATVDDPETEEIENNEAVEANEARGAVLPMGERWRGAGRTGTGEQMLVWAKYKDYAWVHAVDTGGAALEELTYYGNEDDYGTPLYSAGDLAVGALPVQLSSFRPVLENGQVVIRWTTESELDNAGFNILRSDTRDGEFKKINAELIQGAGTTGERHVYKWIDATAKPVLFTTAKLKMYLSLVSVKRLQLLS